MYHGTYPNKYNVIISFLEGHSLLYHDCILKRKDCVQISWVHTDLFSDRWTAFLFNSLENEKECYHQMDRIICVSNDAKNDTYAEDSFENNII